MEQLLCEEGGGRTPVSRLKCLCITNLGEKCCEPYFPDSGTSIGDKRMNLRTKTDRINIRLYINKKI